MFTEYITDFAMNNNKHFVEYDSIANNMADDPFFTDANTEKLAFYFIKRFCLINLNGPTVWEVCRALDIILHGGAKVTSSGHINWVIAKLEEKGLIAVFKRNKHRIGGRIKILEDSWR